MITERATIGALKYLHDTGHVRATEGQARTWHDAITHAVPDADDPDIVTAVRAYAAESVESWTTVAHIVPYVRRALTARTRPRWCERCDERSRHVTAEREDGSPVVVRCPTCHPTTKQLTNH